MTPDAAIGWALDHAAMVEPAQWSGFLAGLALGLFVRR